MASLTAWGVEGGGALGFCIVWGWDGKDFGLLMNKGMVVGLLHD